MDDRDQQIFSMIARYGLVTVNTLAATLFSGLTEKAVERVLTRLLSQERLLSVPLVGRKRYYLLAARTARELGMNAGQAVRPLGPQALLSNYAMLAFCTLASPRHERLRREEFATNLPSLAVSRLLSKSDRTRYFLDKSDASGKVRLGLMVPDLGANPRRLVRKARREVEKRVGLVALFIR